MRQKYQAAILVGAPGSGKGTQGRFAAEDQRYFHLSSGDVFRSLDPSSDIGRVAQDCMTRGALVPDDITISLLQEQITQFQKSTATPQYHACQQLLILDGIPRNPKQARLIDTFVDVCGVIHLHADDQSTLVERMQRRALEQGRTDDANKATILSRFETYRQETVPTIEHYNDNKTPVMTIDALKKPNAVHIDVMDALRTLYESANLYESCSKCPATTRQLSQ